MAKLSNSASGTYVYCVIAAARPPSLAAVPRGLPGTGPVRLVAVDRRHWLAVADAPLEAYSEQAINARLSDLDWVSEAAVAHERVVAAFLDAGALLPMKLFTLFTSDARALDQVRGEWPRIERVLKAVQGHVEWGVRLTLDEKRARRPGAASVAGASGRDYLLAKQQQRDAATALTRQAREQVAALFEELAAQSRDAINRPLAATPAQGGRLLLDAAFLVPTARARRFRGLVSRRARALAPEGYDIQLTGPWPPYSFVQDAS